jgi:hypothetical protein
MDRRFVDELHGRMTDRAKVGHGQAVSTWVSVWTRAVIEPAWRRALAVWVGAAIASAIVFGPTGMQPADLTTLALHAPGVAAVLAATWLLLFLPTARAIVRADAASYLRALPGPWLAPKLVGAGALIAFQLPWIALWVIGEGVRGAGISGALTLVIALVARWRPRTGRPRAPAWHGSGAALRGIYVRALGRRAADALVRGAGLAILAGLAAGLVVRNNHLAGVDAAVMGASVIAIVVVPATVGPAVALLEAHRQSAWLAASLGISRATRVTALVSAVALVQLAASAIASATAAVVLQETAPVAWIAMTSLACGLGAALGNARVMLAAAPAPSVAARLAAGAVVVAAMTVFWLGLLGVAGLAAITATALFALLTVPT